MSEKHRRPGNSMTEKATMQETLGQMPPQGKAFWAPPALLYCSYKIQSSGKENFMSELESHMC